VFGITDFWGYAVGAALITLLPGPNSMYVLAVGARRGARAGYAAVFGVLLGDTVLMVASAGGLAAVLRSHPAVFTLARYAGAAYLTWIGVIMSRQALRRWRGAGEPAGSVPPDWDTSIKETSGGPPFRGALLVSLLNPKMLLFFLSFFVQFVSPGYPRPVLSFVILGAVIQSFSLLYLSALVLGGRVMAQQLHRRRRLAATVGFTAGTVFVGFAVRLATASLG